MQAGSDGHEVANSCLLRVIVTAWPESRYPASLAPNWATSTSLAVARPIRFRTCRDERSTLRGFGGGRAGSVSTWGCGCSGGVAVVLEGGGCWLSPERCVATGQELSALRKANRDLNDKLIAKPVSTTEAVVAFIVGLVVGGVVVGVAAGVTK